MAKNKPNIPYVDNVDPYINLETGAYIYKNPKSVTITKNGNYNVTLLNSIDVNVEGGGSADDDVVFYDYDGTVVTSYSAEKFAKRSSMPTNPTHEGLTAQGWNWTLEDAKKYVAEYGKLNIGQMYITSDGKTRIYIELPEGRTSPVLQLYLNENSKLDIDWGDGGNHSTFTSTEASYQSERHEYATSGEYVITITVKTGSFVLQSSTVSNNVLNILSDGVADSVLNHIYRKAIKRVEIGELVSGIGDNAFSNCNYLNSITMPNTFTVNSIGEKAFIGCNILPYITIPNEISSIKASAFQACTLLYSISIPNTVNSFGANSFNACKSLLSITLPDSITTIDSGMFTDCDVLTFINIPNSVTNISSNAFNSCNALMAVNMSNKLTTLASYAFFNCSLLSSIILPDTVTNMGVQVFYHCSSLTSADILCNISELPNATFEGCTALSSAIISNNITTIGSNAFIDCNTLLYITIPSGINRILASAFSGCDHMFFIKFEPITPPNVSSSTAWSSVSTSTLIIVPVDSYTTYRTKASTSGSYYPNPSTYTYIAYNIYTEGESLPTTTGSYNLTWYASLDDLRAQTNPITVGNGNEVYARASS